ncbi:MULTISPECIES: HAD-IIB family hydrolase [unclassified Lysinibacillus]|uniref:HAD-IIB family hydrolase n=1 Tax=unclassified Lysinibacillus TaxID=2636778 RepID=UPI00131F0E36|nr:MULTISPECIES: HAD-IIB family hydrolase [unclassified Lysinibacillus]
MIFVFDLDGTICFSGAPLDKKIVGALHTIIEQGHEVIFASARPIRDMLPVIPTSLQTCRMIGSNGAFTYVDGFIEVEFLHSSIQSQIVELVESHELAYLADSDWNYAYTGSKNHPMYSGIDSEKKAEKVSIHELTGFSKVLLFDPPTSVKNFVKTLPVTTFEYTEEKILDICSPNLNKIKGLERLGVTHYIAFGNDVNDLLMFKQASHSVCVGMHSVGNHATERIAQHDVHVKIVELGQKWPIS